MTVAALLNKLRAQLHKRRPLGDPDESFVHPAEGFPPTYHDLIMIYVVKAPRQCCAKNSMPPSQ